MLYLIIESVRILQPQGAAEPSGTRGPVFIAAGGGGRLGRAAAKRAQTRGQLCGRRWDRCSASNTAQARMSFFQSLAPIVRGKCDGCGASRNLWVSELGDSLAKQEVRVPCGCPGCEGAMVVAFTGPKGWLPAELAAARCRCAERRRQQQQQQQQKQAAAGQQPAPAVTESCEPEPEPGAALSMGRQAPVAENREPEPEPTGGQEQLHAMGFTDRALNERALAASEGSVDGAVDRLIEADGGEEAEPASPEVCHGLVVSSSSRSDSSVGGADGSSSGVAGGGPGPQDVGECAICTEPLLLADAAMRCAGGGGKQHYYHAHCLGAWVGECQRNGTPASCPQCRGPVQVRRRRLEEFMQEEGGKLGPADRAHRAPALPYSHPRWPLPRLPQAAQLSGGFSHANVKGAASSKTGVWRHGLQATRSAVSGTVCRTQAGRTAVAGGSTSSVTSGVRPVRWRSVRLWP